MSHTDGPVLLPAYTKKSGEVSTRDKVDAYIDELGVIHQELISLCGKYELQVRDTLSDLSYLVIATELILP